MKKKDEIELALLSLSYSRYFSRSHTIFSSLINLFLTVVFGFLSIVFSYSQVFDLRPDLFKILVLGLFAFIALISSSFVAFYKMYESRIERKSIVSKIKTIAL